MFNPSLRGFGAVLAVVGLFVATRPAVAGPVVTGGTETETASFLTASYTYAYDFTSLTNQSLSALGLWDSAADGLAGSYTVGVWRTSTQALLASVIISNADALDTSLTVNGGQWRYEGLPTPLALTSGVTYTLGFYAGAGNWSAADTLLINYPTLTKASTVSVVNEYRFVGGGSLAFPTSTTPANTTYLAHFNAQLVPEPGSAGLLLGGLGLLGLRRRRQ